MRSVSALFVLLAAFAGCEPGNSTPEVVGLDGHRSNPLALGDVSVRVFIFTRTDCPISNRYAPEVRRLHEKFVGDDVGFWLVYPNPDVTPDAIRKHRIDYQYSTPALRDPEHALVKHAGAKVTPEAAVFHGDELVYLGRIDDRYVEFGKARESVSQRDLENAIDALLAGRPVDVARTEAVGCYIVDLQ